MVSLTSCEILDELLKLGIPSPEAIHYFKDYAMYFEREIHSTGLR